jgi:hypothetical protein
MNMRKNMIVIIALFMLISACLLLSGCVILGDHFLWF